MLRPFARNSKLYPELASFQLKLLKIPTIYAPNAINPYLSKSDNETYFNGLKLSDQQRKSYDKYEPSVDNNNYFSGEWGKLVIIK
ncbi:MAG TPA: hypothetical protein PK076_10975 [Saprospiraceae bacterium]|nr:hypothetical protein [Saprospiraceae bacterium]